LPDEDGWAFLARMVEADSAIRLFCPGSRSLQFDVKVVSFLIVQYHLPDAVRADVDETHGGEIDFTAITLSYFLPPPVALSSFNTIPMRNSIVFHQNFSTSRIVPE
jgi:hypothetical protein